MDSKGNYTKSAKLGDTYFVDIMHDASYYAQKISKLLWQIPEIQNLFQQALLYAYWKATCHHRITQFKQTGDIPFFIIRSITEGKQRKLRKLMENIIGNSDEMNSILTKFNINKKNKK